MAVENEGEESSESTSSSTTPLSYLFSHDAEPEAKASSASEPDDKEDEKEEASQDFREVESSPEKDDEKPEKEKKSADQKPVAKPESKPADEKAAADKEAAAQAAEAEAKKKWENDENPFFKRYKDTAQNWQKEHQEKLQLQSAVTQMQQEVGMLRKIADGTYDPEVDDPAKSVTPEMIATQALSVGKAMASKTAAIEQHGKDVVETRLNEFHEKFGENKLIQSLVLNSESPVHEAFRILDRLNFETKYGSTPADIHKNIKAEVEKELRATLKTEITEELMGRADKKHNTPRGLSSSRGSNGLKTGQNSKGKGPTPLNDLFSR
jgi:hypothetical protein